MSYKNKNKIRVFIDQPIMLGELITLNEETSHYLCNVMRLEKGTIISCFNGKDGEFDCEIITSHKKQSILKALKCSKLMQQVPDIWVLFAPVKKDKTDFIIEKSTELGAKRLQPVITERTIVEKVRAERYQAQAIQAAEQCRRVDVPEIEEEQTLDEILKNWNPQRHLFMMDESGQGAPCIETFKKFSDKPAAILIGPEGGFSEEEIKHLYAQPFVSGISLGSRILRAETAAAAALAVWQATAGDWQSL